MIGCGGREAAALFFRHRPFKGPVSSFGFIAMASLSFHRRFAAVLGILVGIVGLGIAGATFAAAQNAAADPAAPAYDEAAVERGKQVFKDGGCRACHGWSANGVREGENIEGPSIRATQLTPEFIKEVVRCGRIGAMMPFFDSRAYNLDERCYGVTRFNKGDTPLPPKGRKGFTEQQLDDLVTYLMARVVGRTKQPTRDECYAFFGADSDFCLTIQ